MNDGLVCFQVDFLINRLLALEEHMKSAEDQLALELDHRCSVLSCISIVSSRI